ncbi:MAG: His/Gly/Thr/Pro-type tRNA ligase C-terminal domain-containing protein [Alistipes ihumii]
MREAGIACEVYPESEDEKADGIRQPARRAVVVIVGSDELASGRATVKNMATGEQQAVAFDELSNRIE